MKPRTFIHSFKNAMATRPAWALLAVCTAALVLPISTSAGPGHDHGDDHGNGAPSATGVASPRFVMSSELFDAVGIVKGNSIEIYVDHAPTNAPVENAMVELELNGNKVPVELHAAGEFDAELPESIKQGYPDPPISVAMTITAGDQVDLLAGELNLASGDGHISNEKSHSHSFEFALYGLGGLSMLAVAFFGLNRMKKRNQSRGGK